jgi:hypothetical protein
MHGDHLKFAKRDIPHDMRTKRLMPAEGIPLAGSSPRRRLPERIDQRRCGQSRVLRLVS